MRTKGQVWSLDLMAGLALFLVSIMIFFTYSLNQPSQARESLELLSYDGNIIAENIMSEGYPLDWDSDNVVSLGITSNDKINQSKLENLYQMIYVQGNYSKTKNILNTRYDYYIFLTENMTTSAGEVDGIGKPGVTKNNIEALNLIKVTRFTIYQNKTTTLNIYVWEE